MVLLYVTNSKNSNRSPITVNDPRRDHHARAEGDRIHPQADARAGGEVSRATHPTQPYTAAAQHRPDERYGGHDHAAYCQGHA